MATANDSVLDRRFWSYHATRPEIFKAFRLYARKYKAKGYKKIGSKFIISKLRQERDLTVSNDYTSRYVRLLEAANPEFRGRFSKRILDHSMFNLV